MGMRGLAGRLDKPAHADRVNDYIDTIDKVIGKVRDSIFQIRARRQHPAGLQAEFLELLDQHTPQLGFTPASASPAPWTQPRTRH